MQAGAAGTLVSPNSHQSGSVRWAAGAHSWGPRLTEAEIQ